MYTNTITDAVAGSEKLPPLARRAGRVASTGRSLVSMSATCAHTRGAADIPAMRTGTTEFTVTTAKRVGETELCSQDKRQECVRFYAKAGPMVSRSTFTLKKRMCEKRFWACMHGLSLFWHPCLRIFPIYRSTSSVLPTRSTLLPPYDDMYSSVSNTEIHLSIKRERAVYRLREYLPPTARPARASNARAPGYGRVGSGICVTPRALKASVSKGPIIAPLALIGRGNDLDALMLLGV